MKKKNVIITLNADEIIEKVKQKYGETPIFSEKAKELQAEIKGNEKLKEQIDNFKHANKLV